MDVSVLNVLLLFELAGTESISAGCISLTDLLSCRMVEAMPHENGRFWWCLMSWKADVTCQYIIARRQRSRGTHVYQT